MVVRVDAVVSGSSYLQTCIAAAFNQRQSRIGGPSSLGLDGTSHVAMSIAWKLGKDIYRPARPRCRTISSTVLQPHHHLSTRLIRILDPQPSFYLSSYPPSSWFSDSVAPRSLLLSRSMSSRLVVPPQSRSSTRMSAARALTTASSPVLLS